MGRQQPSESLFAPWQISEFDWNGGNGNQAYMDIIAMYHGNVNTEGFADGHAEIHKWRDPRTIRPVTYTTVQRISITTFSPDLAYIAAHTPRGQ